MGEAGTGYIWSREQLLAFLKDGREEVQGWAADHALRLYPGLAGDVLPLVPRLPKRAAQDVLKSLIDLPEAAGIPMAPLRETLEQAESPLARALAAALLVREGQPPSDDSLAALSFSSARQEMARTQPGFEFLLRQLQRGDTEDKLQRQLLEGMAEACAAGDFFALLVDQSEDWKSEVRETAESIEEQWGRTPPDVTEVKGAQEALAFLQKALEETQPNSASGPSSFPTLIADLNETRRRIARVSEATSESLIVGGERGVTALLLACALVLHRDAICREWLQSSPDMDDLWAALTVRQWAAREVDPDVLARLRDNAGEGAGQVLIDVLDVGWTYASYAFRCLLASGVPGRYAALLDAADIYGGHDLGDEIHHTIEWAGPGVASAAIARWRQDPPDGGDLLWLGHFPTTEVVRFLLDNFYDLIKSPGASEFVEILGQIGAKEFLEPLRREWRPDEHIMESSIAIIASLNGVSDKQTEGFAERTRKRRREFEESLASVESIEDLLLKTGQEPLSLPLRCTACGRTYRYEVKQLLAGAKGKDGEITLGDIIQCKGCGSIETYEKAPGGSIALSGALFRLVEAKRAGKSLRDLPYSITRAEIRAVGRRFDSLSDAYHFLVRAIEREPENSDLRKRLANVLRQGGRSDLALPVYKEAVRLDPTDADAIYSIADIYMEDGKFLDAVPYADMLPEAVRRARVSEGTRREMFAKMLLMLSFIGAETRHSVPMLMQSSVPSGEGLDLGKTARLLDLDLDSPYDVERLYRVFMGRMSMEEARERAFTATERREPVRAEKVGRNEPCPCGSGKKYKKCHGR